MRTQPVGEVSTLKSAPSVKRPRSPLALATAIEAEYVTKMMLAHQAASGETLARLSAARGATNTGLDVELFVALTLQGDPAALIERIDALQDNGVPSQTLYLELLGPAARRLGEMWTEDLVSFLEVTLALGNLQRLLRHLQATSPPAVQTPRPGFRRALFAAPPGEQHTFGLSIVADIFERAGWRVALEPIATPAELAAIVRGQQFDLAGFTASGPVTVRRLPRLIRDLRRCSRNSRLLVVVGGVGFDGRAELAARVGADAAIQDAAQAVVAAENMLDLATRID